MIKFLLEKTLKNFLEISSTYDFHALQVPTIFHTWTLVSFREYERLKWTPTPLPSDNYT